MIVGKLKVLYVFVAKLTISSSGKRNNEKFTAVKRFCASCERKISRKRHVKFTRTVEFGIHRVCPLNLKCSLSILPASLTKVSSETKVLWGKIVDFMSSGCPVSEAMSLYLNAGASNSSYRHQSANFSEAEF